MRQIVSVALLTFGVISLVTLARCADYPEVVRAPDGGADACADAGDGGVPCT